MGSKPIVPLTGRLATKFGGPSGCDLGERVGGKLGGHGLVAPAGLRQLPETFPGFCQSEDSPFAEQSLRPARHQRRISLDGGLQPALGPLSVDEQHLRALRGRCVCHQQFRPAGRIGAWIATDHLVEGVHLARRYRRQARIPALRAGGLGLRRHHAICHEGGKGCGKPGQDRAEVGTDTIDDFQCCLSEVVVANFLLCQCQIDTVGIERARFVGGQPRAALSIRRHAGPSATVVR